MKPNSRVFRFLDRWHWVLLILAGPFLLFPRPILTPFLLVVPLVWLFGWLARREFVPRTPLNLTLLATYLMVLVSLFASYDMEVSLPKVAGMVLGAGAFFAMAREARTRKGLLWAWLFFLAAGLGVALIGLLGTEWPSKIGISLAPLTNLIPDLGTSFHPNEVAGAVLWVLPAFAALSLYSLRLLPELRARRGAGFAWGAVALANLGTLFAAGVLALTQSRTGYLALGITGVVMLFAVLPKWGRWALGGGIVLVIVAATVLLSLGVGQSYWEQVKYEAIFTQDTIPKREEIWSRALYAIQDYPYTGMGMNVFRYRVGVLYPFYQLDTETDLGHAHNEILQAALDLGLPGLVAFLALNVGGFGMAIGVWRRAERLEPGGSGALSKAMALGMGGGLLAHFLYGLMDAVSLGAKPGFLFWMLLGLLAGAYGLVREGEA